MSRVYSHTIADALKDFFIQSDWKFSFDEDMGVFCFGLKMKGQTMNIIYTIIVTESSYGVYAKMPIGADSTDSSMMATFAEFICRANYGQGNGNFEFDFRNGNIRYKVFVDCDGIVPPKKIIQNSIWYPAVMFERYTPGIIGIILNGFSAKDAVEKCEKADIALLGELISDHPEMAELASKSKLGLGDTLVSDKE